MRQIELAIRTMQGCLDKWTDRDYVEKVCDENVHQMIGYYQGSLDQIKYDLETLKKMIEDEE
jgi:hypothetical protein